MGSDDFLLDAFLPDSHHDAPLFPFADADAARSPLTNFRRRGCSTPCSTSQSVI